MSDKTCAERIDAEYESTMETLRILWAGYCHDECPTCEGTGRKCQCDDSPCPECPDGVNICPSCDGTGNLSEDTPEYGNLFEYGLSFDYCYPDKGNPGYFRYQLSWGGPSDEFRIYADKKNDWDFPVWKIVYVFEDWFDHAEKALHGEDFKLMETIFSQFFTECGTTNHVYMEAMENWNDEEEDEEVD